MRDICGINREHEPARRPAQRPRPGRPTAGRHPAWRARCRGWRRAPPGAGADRRRRRRRLMALCRNLHRQHPQPAHAARLWAGVRPVLCLVRGTRPGADDDPAARCRHLYRGASGDPFGAGREAAARGRADDVRLADRRPGDAVQSGLGGARAQARGQDRQDAGARRPGMAAADRHHPGRHRAGICATGR
jgi:hypothetical protein